MRQSSFSSETHYLKRCTYIHIQTFCLHAKTIPNPKAFMMVFIGKVHANLFSLVAFETTNVTTNTPNLPFTTIFNYLQL